MESQEYSRIAAAYLDDVYRAALSCCHSKSDAEDAVQNTFLKLMSTDTVFNGEEHIRRWLIRVAVNECKNSMTSFWRRNVCSLETLEQEPGETTQEERELLYEVGRLSPKYSSVLHLYYYEGYSCSEIADILHISESNVQTRLLRARKMLKNNLEEA